MKQDNVKQQNNTKSEARKTKGKTGLIVLAVLLIGALVIGAVFAIHGALSRQVPDGTEGSAALPTVTLTREATDPAKTSTRELSTTHAPEPSTETAGTGTEQPTELPYDDGTTFPIDLGFVVLRYPKRWENAVTLTGAEPHDPADRFALSFSDGGTTLFTLRFNDEEGDILGTILGTVNTTLRVTVDSGLADERKREMQDDVNVILEHLNEEYCFVAGKIIQNQDDSLFYFETPLGTLCYPQKWEDRVTVEVSEVVISFSEGDTPIFDLVMIDSEGYLLGSYDGKPVYLYEYAVENEDQSAMQDDVNVILQKLMEDPKFSVNK